MATTRHFDFLILGSGIAGLSFALKVASRGRVAIITFHSGEDRRVKKAFQAGLRDGVYADVAREVVRSTKEETFANRRASSAKLRWAVRSATGPSTP